MTETWLTNHAWCTRQSWRSPGGMTFWPSGRMTVPPRVIVIHSTETTSWPGYSAGAAAPHFTIDLPSGRVRQHVPLEWGSRCLAVSTGGITDRTVNISGTIQIEVIGAVTPGYPARYGHYDLPGRFPTDKVAQAHLARLLRAIHDSTGIPLQMAPGLTWVSYPASYGVRARQRLTSARFRSVRGVLGHQHAPANDHGDGLLGRAMGGRATDMEAVLALAGGSAPAPPVTPGRDGGVFFEGATGTDVRTWQTSLVDVGHDLDPDGIFGPLTTAATRDFQSDHGITVDGRVGPETRTTMEDTMSKIDAVLAETRAIRADLKRTDAKVDTQHQVTTRTLASISDAVAKIPGAVWAHRLYGFVAHYWLRRGAIADPGHRHFPADPGSPAHKELLAEVAQRGYATIYAPDGETRLRLTDEGTFEIEED